MAKDREERPQDPAAAEKLASEAIAKVAVPDPRGAVREALAKVPGGAGAKGVMTKTLTSADAVASQGPRTPRIKLKLSAARGALVLYAFAGDRLQLGRDAIDKSANDVCLRCRGANADVGSRKINSAHMRVEIDPAKGVLVKDLETTNGTKIGGQRLAPKAPFPVRSTARIDVAGALDLEMRVIAAEKAGQPPAAVVILRPSNGTDQAYALVRERLFLNENNGLPVAGAHAGSILAPTENGFTLNNQPIAPGAALEMSGLKIEVAEIRPEDMK
jgi:hypothetical protein